MYAPDTTHSADWPLPTGLPAPVPHSGHHNHHHHPCPVLSTSLSPYSPSPVHAHMLERHHQIPGGYSSATSDYYPDPDIRDHHTTQQYHQHGSSPYQRWNKYPQSGGGGADWHPHSKLSSSPQSYPPTFGARSPYSGSSIEESQWGSHLYDSQPPPNSSLSQALGASHAFSPENSPTNPTNIHHPYQHHQHQHSQSSLSPYSDTSSPTLERYTLDHNSSGTNTATTPNLPPSSSGGATIVVGNPPVKTCSHCGATTTPLWRRDPRTQAPLCNACGLYLQTRNKLRPQRLIDVDASDLDGTAGDPSSFNPDSSSSSSAGGGGGGAGLIPIDPDGRQCSHCQTRCTSVWRRSKEGEHLCNACGVYLRLRGKSRPLKLSGNKFRPRSRHTPDSTLLQTPPPPQGTAAHTHMHIKEEYI